MPCHPQRPRWCGSGTAEGGLTIYQEGPEQAQATEADVSVLEEAVQMLQDKLTQPSLLQLLGGRLWAARDGALQKPFWVPPHPPWARLMSTWNPKMRTGAGSRGTVRFQDCCPPTAGETQLWAGPCLPRSMLCPFTVW